MLWGFGVLVWYKGGMKYSGGVGCRTSSPYWRDMTADIGSVYGVSSYRTFWKLDKSGETKVITL